VQEGPFDAPGPSPSSAWEQTLEPILSDIIKGIPHHAAVLLSIFAAWELDEDEDTEHIVAVWPDGMKQLLQRELAEEAGERTLDD
jgi:hypothetical protein